MNIRPLHDHVLVTRIEAATQSAGGIYIPPTAQEKSTEGKVVAVGTGAVLSDGSVRPLDVKVGDRILFGKYTGTEITVDGEKALLVREGEILAVLDAE